MEYLFGVGFLENAKYFFSDGTIRNIKGEIIGRFNVDFPYDESYWVFGAE